MQKIYYVLGATFIVYLIYLHTQAFLTPSAPVSCPTGHDDTHKNPAERLDRSEWKDGNLEVSVEFMRDQYLKIVATSLTGTLLETAWVVPGVGTEAHPMPYEPERRRAGVDWPLFGYTMTGDLRVGALRNLLEDCVQNSVEGDFIELGVWRGGTSIMAAAVFKVYNQMHRNVWVCDSFEGLPAAAVGLPDGNHWSQMAYLRVSQEQVMHNFQKYELLNDNVKFIKGFFFESLPKLRHQQTHSSWKLSLLRLDGDMYESCLDSIFNLYEFLSVGGYVIIDDWSIQACQDAITEFLRTHNLQPQIVPIDGASVYWKKERSHDVPVNYKHYVDIKAKSDRPVTVDFN